jgi:hypothetical protein
MTFRDQIQTIGREFPSARKGKFASHPLANKIRKSWPDSLKNLLSPARVAEYKFDASPRQGQWSSSPPEAHLGF